jgi:hypothetical protein
MRKKRVLELLQAVGKAVLMGVASGIGKTIWLLMLSLFIR